MKFKIQSSLNCEKAHNHWIQASELCAPYVKEMYVFTDNVTLYNNCEKLNENIQKLKHFDLAIVGDSTSRGFYVEIVNILGGNWTKLKDDKHTSHKSMNLTFEFAGDIKEIMRKIRCARFLVVGHGLWSVYRRTYNETMNEFKDVMKQIKGK